MGFWGFILGFHKQTKIIKDEQTKNLNKHYHRIMGLDDENYYFIFQGENTS